MFPAYRRSPRLPEEDNIGPLAAHVIFVARQRRSLFSSVDLASTCLVALQESIGSFGADLVAYCIMPDHAHLLVQIPEGVSLQDWARRAKQLSGFRLKRATGDFAWQISYYDHILRREEALIDVAKYIWENPVTAGLVTAPELYEWSGPAEFIAQA
jgi:REP element-mobilizing transposase RayT